MRRWQIALLIIVAGAGLVFPAYRMGAQSSASFSLPAWGILSGGGPTSSPSFSSQTNVGAAAQQSLSSPSFVLGPALLHPALLSPPSQTNHPPQAINDAVRVFRDSSANPVNVLGNDSDPDGDPLRVTSVTQGTKGRAGVGPIGGSVLYTPDPGFTGNDSFSYTISDGHLTASATVAVTVIAHAAATNGAPVALNDSATVYQDRSDNVIDVMANDTDPDGDAIRVVAFTQPVYGKAQLGPGGANLLYTPRTGFVGADALTYTISDGHDATSTAILSITIAANRSAVAAQDQISIPQNSSNVHVNVLENDRDPEGNSLTITGVSQPSHGTAFIGPGSTNVIYTPEAGFSGTDSFSYTVTDGYSTSSGSVTVVVTPVNSRPVASDDIVRVPQDSTDNMIDVLSNDGDPDRNPLAITLVSRSPSSQGVIGINQKGTGIIYTPARGFVGTESYDYTASDGALTDTATVTITVQGSRIFLPLLLQGLP